MGKIPVFEVPLVICNALSKSALPSVPGTIRDLRISSGRLDLPVRPMEVGH